MIVQSPAFMAKIVGVRRLPSLDDTKTLSSMGSLCRSAKEQPNHHHSTVVDSAKEEPGPSLCSKGGPSRRRRSLGRYRTGSSGNLVKKSSDKPQEKKNKKKVVERPLTPGARGRTLLRSSTNTDGAKLIDRRTKEEPKSRSKTQKDIEKIIGGRRHWSMTTIASRTEGTTNTDQADDSEMLLPHKENSSSPSSSPPSSPNTNGWRTPVLLEVPKAINSSSASPRDVSQLFSGNANDFKGEGSDLFPDDRSIMTVEDARIAFRAQQTEIDSLRKQVEALTIHVVNLSNEDNRVTPPETTPVAGRHVESMRHTPVGHINGIYTGQVDSNKLPDGKGRIIFYNGDSYHGPFERGQMHGPNGVYIYGATGNVYSGQFRNNLRHGHGETRFMEDGMRKYVGSYENDKPHGYGEEYGRHGDLVFRGQWEDGKPAHVMLAPFAEEDSETYTEPSPQWTMAADRWAI